MRRIIIILCFIVLAASLFFISPAPDNVNFVKNGYICNEPIVINYTSSIYSDMKLYRIDNYGVTIWESGVQGTGEMTIPGQAVAGRHIIELHNEEGTTNDEMMIYPCGVRY